MKQTPREKMLTNILSWRLFMIFITALVLAFLTTEAFPGPQADLRWSRDATAQYQQILKRIPSTKKNVVMDAVKSFENQVSSLKGKDHDYYALAQKTNRSFSLNGLEQVDVSEMAFLSMMMAAKDMDDDIRMIMAEIKAMTQAKQRLRELIKELNEWISGEMENMSGAEDIDNEPVSGRGSQQDEMERTLPNHIGEKITGAMTTPNYKIEYFKAPVVKRTSNPEKMSANQIREELREKKKNLAAMNRGIVVMNEGLHLLLDRRSKFIQILSGLLKKEPNGNDKPSKKSKGGTTKGGLSINK